MKRAKVTFFMIAYNEEKWIQKAIQSILDQTEPDIELYVRNNGSTDRTGEIVQEIAAQDSRIHLVENRMNWWKDEDGKIPFINEKGAVDIWPINRETLGNYISFLDADDRIEPTFVEKLLRIAQKEQAEITVCGSMFLQDGITPVGQRLPPPLHLKKREEWGPALSDFNTFVQLYNSFRTYWGKLFQREFFLRYYNEAWQPIGGKYGAFLDTVTMLRYLQRCERLSCAAAPLYYFTVSQTGSTYSNPPLAATISKALQAETLFDEGITLLQNVGAATVPNYQLLYQLNWAFCWEAMEGLQRKKKHVALQDIDRIIVLLNNKVAQTYLANSSKEIWRQIEPILQNLWEQSGQNFELYLRYPIRLMYIHKLITVCRDSELLPPLVLGVLCDSENTNLLGKDLIQCILSHSPGIKKSVECYRSMVWSERHNLSNNWWVDEIEQFDDEDGTAYILAQQLRDYFERGDYEDACETLSKLGKKSPLHRDGIFYRIQMAELIGEHELAVVLAASARVLFGLDIEMQNLCWIILSQEEVSQ